MSATSRMRSRWTWWTAFLSALVLIAQVPAQAVDSAATAAATPSSASAAPGPQTQMCTARPIADPPSWERNLPIASASPVLSATDPACVHETGRDATSVMWRNPNGSYTARMYDAPVNYKDANGSWQAIDTRLVSDGQGGFTNKAGPFSVHFGASAASANLLTVSGLRVDLARLQGRVECVIRNPHAHSGSWCRKRRRCRHTHLRGFVAEHRICDIRCCLTGSKKRSY